jgi:D-alanine transaminase
MDLRHSRTANGKTREVPMTEYIWIDGRVMSLGDASVSVEDRGFQFADGVYEVIRIYSGVAFTLAEHLERLARSAQGILLDLPMPASEIEEAIRDLIERSGVTDGMVYLQLTRGAAPRNHVIAKGTRPTLLFYVRALEPVAAPGTAPGAKLCSVEDQRWKNCWIKSIALLPNILAKNQAARSGCDEAVFVENGRTSECSASNFFTVVDRTLITAPVGPKVLPGITRAILLQIAPQIGLSVEERCIGVAEALGADELFITSTTRELSWVREWDGKIIANGRCGPITLKLHQKYQQRVQQAIESADQRQPSLALT